ncbi:MAG: hypothetical protein ACRD1T_23090, partial [Acidimicrobiia bacterium]
IGGETGPAVLLKGAKKAIEDAELGSMAMGVIGIRAVNAHNEAMETHVKNLQKGVEGMDSLKEKLNTLGNNWKASDDRLDYVE